MSRVAIEAFANAEAAAAAAAEAIADQLRGPEGKSLIVTGGRGPGPVYDRLANADLDWASVIVTLSDDRFVPLGAAESNEAMVRARLLQGRASAARLVPLNGAEQTPHAAAEAVEPDIATLAPFDAILLGMGPDGHIASLYASNSDAAQWLRPDCPRWAVGVQSAGWTPYVPRVSLTGRALFDGKLIILLIGGEDKRAVIEQIEADPVFNPPAAALLRQTRSPVRVLWSPDAA